jgi:hypothetical protein
VRVHADAKAAESAGMMNALAYTVGQDVVFGAGQFAPATNSPFANNVPPFALNLRRAAHIRK